MNNIPKNLVDKIHNNYHTKTNHPISIIKNMIYGYAIKDIRNFKFIDDLDPIVSVENNFDNLLIPKDHPSRNYSDTYYFSENQVLRTHMTAHMNDLLKKHDAYLCCGQVFRNDKPDMTHSNMFHQLEGCYLMDGTNEECEKDLKLWLSGMIENVLCNKEYRFNGDYFPFTNPSFEVEVNFGSKDKPVWIEILGCGVIMPEILNKLGIKKNGWAFGIGIERMAMILFDINNIHYLHNDDNRFVEQFKEGSIIKYKHKNYHPLIRKNITLLVGENDIKDGVWINYKKCYDIIVGCNGVYKVELKNIYIGKNKNSVCLNIDFEEVNLEETNSSIINKNCLKNLDNVINVLKNNGFVL